MKTISKKKLMNLLLNLLLMVLKQYKQLKKVKKQLNLLIQLKKGIYF